MAHRGNWRRSAEVKPGEVAGDPAIEGKPGGLAAHNGKNHSVRGEEEERQGFGPAAPLKPLYIAAAAPSSSQPARPLPHPSTYAGSDNWAFTPSDTIPSLPATPSRSGVRDQYYTSAGMSSHRGNAVSGGDLASPIGPPVRPSSREGGQFGIHQPISARSVFNRRLEEHRTHSPSPVRNQKPSPRMPYANLANSSTTNPLAASMRGMGMSDTASPALPSPTSVTSIQHPSSSIAAVLSQAANSSESSPALRHRDSFASTASSNAAGLGQHPLMHSRRASQVFVQSPTSQAYAPGPVAGSARATPAYRVYRPPHLRTDSYFALQPRMAHYDRVSAPTMRGQSRSPSMSMSHTGSSAVSRTTSEHPSLSPDSAGRRLSALGVHNTLLQNASAGTSDVDPQSNPIDTSSLIAKLAKARLNLLGNSGRDGSPQNSERQSAARNSAVEMEDFDLTAEDMMMMSGTLTDQYCRSRSSSMSMSVSDVDAIDIFDVGDRLGPGMTHDGHLITIAETSKGFHDQSADWSGSQLEVMSKLGEGSYATVYLVKEVARRDADVTSGGEDETMRRETDGDIFSTTLKASASGRLAEESSNQTVMGRSPEAEEGENYFALKCLCKRDLSDEMLEVQRLEATIHQSIPPHSNIVTLYRTYETPEWLFLVLEYCPGQDLFYWLEQAQDAENLGAVTPGDGDSNGSISDLNEVDSTPPSPGLLATTEMKHLLSRRRLRLISRMFMQMCDAVEFCHKRGIAHRDIKPENFIVEDTRASTMQTANGADERSSNVDGVKVKLTDFGLAVAQTHCIDFDCGSKPYMSYECRNNASRSYDPMQSDVWSLGIVLLNLIFHRNPFSEPNAERCPSFASYIDDPIFFLTTAFRGLKEEAARYLAQNVFCDVTEGEDGTRRKRISARSLGEWASNLAEHLNVKGSGQLTLLQTHLDTGADFGITSPLWHSRSPASSHVNSVLASPASNARSISIHRELTQMGIPEDEIESFTPLFADSATPTTMGDRPRPPSTPFRSSMGTTDEGLKQIDEENVLTVSNVTATKDEQDDLSPARNDDLHAHDNVIKEANDDVQEDVDATLALNDDEVGIENKSINGSEADQISLPPSTTSTTAKRRKRGARRGRTLAKQQMKRSRSVENLQAKNERKGADGVSNETERDRTIRELAEASQSLAREMSKAMVAKDSAALGSGLSPGIPQKPTAKLPSNGATTSALTSTRPVMKPVHASATVADWRERNGSHASLASVSSFDTLNSFSSDVASIRSTASAPPALLAHGLGRGPTSSFGAMTTISTTSTRHSGLSAWRTSASGSRPLPSNALHTINERGGATPQRASHSQQKDLDASYLAEIFGGRVSERSAQQHGQDDDHSSSGARRSRDALGVQGGALAVPGKISSSADPSTSRPSDQALSLASPISTPGDSASQSVLEAPRKKMLGKFLHGVKNYNKGVKAAPGIPGLSHDATGASRPQTANEDRGSN